MFTRACEYAIRAVMYIQLKSGDNYRLSIPEISKQIDAPPPFTAKILQTLVRGGIINSIKGPNGGFFIAAKARPISLSAIVKVIDGNDDVLHNCVLGLKECSDTFPCPIHHQVKQYKDQLRKVMREATVQSLVDDLDKGNTFLKNKRSRKSTR